MRLFVAFNLPGEDRDEIYEAGRPLRDRDLPIRWVRPENYHVTLKFLGKVDADRTDGIARALAECTREAEPFPVELSGFGAFPTIRRPNVLWFGVEASPELRSLKHDLEWALADQGFEREARTFHPHVTVGRARKKGRAGAFRGLDEIVAGIDVACEPRLESIDLMRSVLSSEGPQYSVVSSIPLGAAD